MAAPAGVSQRTGAIYREFYQERETARFETLYGIFSQLSHFAEASDEGVQLRLDYLRLVEAIRSYFLDTIRYKEYHFDPKEDDPEVEAILAKQGASSISELDPMSREWAELVHRTAKINGSKVAAYTVKWLLRCRPISVVTPVPANEEELRRVEALPPPKQQSSFIANINEHFAIQSALYALELDIRDVALHRMNELLYNLRFRPFEESTYFMILSKEYLCSSHA